MLASAGAIHLVPVTATVQLAHRDSALRLLVSPCGRLPHIGESLIAEPANLRGVIARSQQSVVTKWVAMIAVQVAPNPS